MTGSGSTSAAPQAHASAPTPASNSSAPDPARKIRLFILDDHEMVRRGLRDLFESADDIEVVGESGSAVEAEARIPALHPDVALLDGRLPDGSGVDVCRAIRSVDPSIRAIILTSYDDEEALFAAIMAGAAGYVLKQVVANDLLAGVRQVANGQSLLDPAVTQRVLNRLREGGSSEPAELRSLTPQERRVLELVTEGLTNRQIGEQLFLAEKTIKNYVTSILNKLGLQGAHPGGGARLQAAQLTLRLSRVTASGGLSLARDRNHRVHAGAMVPALSSSRSGAVPVAAFAAGAVVALLVGVFGKVHDPTLDGTTTLGYSTVLAMKVVLSTVVGVLAVLQVVGALWIYGKLGIKAPSWLGTAHRISGIVTLALVVFVAYHCLWALGLESGRLANGEKVPTRTVVHGVLGCVAMGAIVVKVVAVRSRRAPGWFLPVAGGLLFTLLVLVVLTSAVWYVSEKGWPTASYS